MTETPILTSLSLQIIMVGVFLFHQFANIYIDENGVAYIFEPGGTGSPPSGAIFLDVDINPTNPVYLVSGMRNIFMMVWLEEIQWLDVYMLENFFCRCFSK